MDDAASSRINFHNEADRPGRITITGNVVRRSASHGIQARTGGRGATYPTESIIITSNRVEDSGGNGIQAGYILTDRGVVATSNTVVRAKGVPLRMLRLDGVVAHSNHLVGGAQIGAEYGTVVHGVLGPDSIDAGTPTGPRTGIKAPNVRRSKITPGAVQSPDPGSVGVEIGASCADLALGPTARLDAPTPLVNNGPATVRAY